MNIDWQIERYRIQSAKRREIRETGHMQIAFGPHKIRETISDPIRSVKNMAGLSLFWGFEGPSLENVSELV